MIVITRRYRKTGRGFGNLSEKIVSTAINTATSPPITQKIKEAAVNSALETTQQAIRKV